MSSRGTEDVRVVVNKRSNAVLKRARGAKGRNTGEQTEDVAPSVRTRAIPSAQLCSDDTGLGANPSTSKSDTNNLLQIDQRGTGPGRGEPK